MSTVLLPILYHQLRSCIHWSQLDVSFNICLLLSVMYMILNLSFSVVRIGDPPLEVDLETVDNSTGLGKKKVRTIILCIAMCIWIIHMYMYVKY